MSRFLLALALAALVGCTEPGDGQNMRVDPKAFAAVPWP